MLQKIPKQFQGSLIFVGGSTQHRRNMEEKRLHQCERSSFACPERPLFLSQIAYYVLQRADS
jgi:hypothetical protein